MYGYLMVALWLTAVSAHAQQPQRFSAILTPVSLDFPNTTLGSTSDVQTIVVNNTGTISGSIGGFAVTGDFLIAANTCKATLAPGTGCTISIAFRPTTSGTRAETFSMMSDSGPLTAALHGTGTTVATGTLSATSLSFSPTLLNSTSAAQTLTIRNDGDVPLTLISASILSGSFAVTNGCGTTLAAHSACALQVTFSPVSVGPQTGVLIVRDALGAQTVTLTGTGLAPAGVSLAPAAFAFGPVGVGVASEPQTFTLTNNGAFPLVISNIGLTGDFGLTSSANACSTVTPLPVGASCKLVVALIPQAAGARSGSLLLASNASNSPQTAALSGTGVDFTFSASGTTTRSIASGGTATFAAVLTPILTMPQSVSLACTSSPANAKCTISPASTDLNGQQTITITLRTGLSANAVRVPATIAVGFLLSFALAWNRKRRIVALLTLFILIGEITGCGAGRQIPDNYSDGGTNGGGTTLVTPPGNYPVVVTATAAGLSRGVTFNVVVQ
ncbi:MAG: choice-of-anchor D domain-containing protein [Acidobacteria bacterium]|nr:choice-of-anchor D domain-containing protein [Acidobacteriota bacterium]